MKKLYAMVLSMSLLVLTACGSSSSSSGSDSGPLVTVDELDAGAYTVSVGSEENLQVGKYLSDGAGNRLLILADNDLASQVYTQTEGGMWTAVPEPSGDTTVTMSNITVDAFQPLSTADVIGHFVSQTQDDRLISFLVDAAGEISSTGSSCELSGTITEGDLPGVLMVELTTAGCNAPSQLSGVLLSDSNYAPSSFRIIADNGEQLIEYWAFDEPL